VQQARRCAASSATRGLGRGLQLTVEPGINCGLGLDVQKPITREQAEVMVDICASLQAK
jgi:hypothetical protein